MTTPNSPTDPIGPGTPAWAYSEAAILAGVNNDPDSLQANLKSMTRELIINNASVQTIREWETFVHEAVVNKRMSPEGEWIS